jgi:hypothetical protein
MWNRSGVADVRRRESRSPSQVLRIGGDQNISIVSGDRLSGYSVALRNDPCICRLLLSTELERFLEKKVLGSDGASGTAATCGDHRLVGYEPLRHLQGGCFLATSRNHVEELS